MRTTINAMRERTIEKNMFLAFDILSSIVCHWYQTGYPSLVLGLIIANILNPHRTKKIDLGLELLQEDFEKRYNMDKIPWQNCF